MTTRLPCRTRSQLRGRWHRARFGSLELIIVVAMLAIVLAALLPMFHGCAESAQQGSQLMFEREMLIHDHLLAYYDFDAHRGSIAYNAATPAGKIEDYDPNAYIGILRRNASWSDGRWPGGGSVYLDGQGAHVAMGSFDIETDEGEDDGMTVVCAFMAYDLPGDSVLISKASGPQAQFWTFSITPQDNARRLSFTLRTEDGVKTVVAETGDLPTDVWVHAACTYNGNTMRLFLDGAEVGSGQHSGAILTDESAPVWIGDLPPTPSTQPFDGLIDELMIFGKALPRDLIQEHHRRNARSR